MKVLYLVDLQQDYETSMIRKKSSELQIAGKVVGIMRRY